jgi:aryl-alcohol dehydrogenase-like predicted oxidoreductase
MQVSVLGLGAAEIGFANTPDRIVDALLGVAFDSGLNVIDTAECYLDSEEKLGRVLEGRRQQCFLFTKCGHAPPPRSRGLMSRAARKLVRPIARAVGRALPDWHPRLLEQSIERSLRRLKTDWLDLIQLHSCSHEMLRRGEVIEVLQRARQSGKTRYIGYSGDGQGALFAIQSGQFDALETSLNVADQEAFLLTLPLAAEAGLGVIVKRPVANAVWNNASRPDNSYHHAYWDRLQALHYDFLRQPAGLATALRFTLSAPGVHTALVGTTNPEHLRENIGFAAQGPLEGPRIEAIHARWKQVAGPDWIGQE